MLNFFLDSEEDAKQRAATGRCSLPPKKLIDSASAVSDDEPERTLKTNLPRTLKQVESSRQSKQQQLMALYDQKVLYYVIRLY